MDLLECATRPDAATETPTTPERPRIPLGSVALIGAGPGDPELMTVKGLRLLRAADVVVYDRLVAPELLDEVRPGAELIYAGKRSGCHALPQAEINHLLIARARLGLCVARLKGGDPFVFGRGGEEALALAEAGIPFQVVPGVTSAIAAPASAGIPVSQRGMATSFTVFTAHGQRDGQARQSMPAQDAHDEAATSGPDWCALAALAASGGTLVALMGVATLPDVASRLIAAGLSPSTPAAVIERGTLPGQRIVSGPLGAIAQRAAAAGLHSPAATVIGAVAALAESLGPALALAEATRADSSYDAAHLARLSHSA